MRPPVSYTQGMVFGCETHPLEVGTFKEKREEKQRKGEKRGKSKREKEETQRHIKAKEK